MKQLAGGSSPWNEHSPAAYRSTSRMRAELGNSFCTVQNEDRTQFYNGLNTTVSKLCQISKQILKCCIFCVYVIQFDVGRSMHHHTFHLVVCLTTGPKPLPKRALHIVRSRASSFKWESSYNSNKLTNQMQEFYNFFYLTFMYRSACFGRLHTHHQELTTALTASGFTVGEWR
jgi:hypothetical protein